MSIFTLLFFFLFFSFSQSQKKQCTHIARQEDEQLLPPPSEIQTYSSVNRDGIFILYLRFPVLQNGYFFITNSSISNVVSFAPLQKFSISQFDLFPLIQQYALNVKIHQPSQLSDFDIYYRPLQTRNVLYNLKMLIPSRRKLTSNCTNDFIYHLDFMDAPNDFIDMYERGVEISRMVTQHSFSQTFFLFYFRKFMGLFEGTGIPFHYSYSVQQTKKIFQKNNFHLYYVKLDNIDKYDSYDIYNVTCISKYPLRCSIDDYNINNDVYTHNYNLCYNNGKHEQCVSNYDKYNNMTNVINFTAVEISNNEKYQKKINFNAYEVVVFEGHGFSGFKEDINYMTVISKNVRFVSFANWFYTVYYTVKIHIDKSNVDFSSFAVITQHYIAKSIPQSPDDPIFTGTSRDIWKNINSTLNRTEAPPFNDLSTQTYKKHRINSDGIIDISFSSIFPGAFGHYSLTHQVYFVLFNDVSGTNGNGNRKKSVVSYTSTTIETFSPFITINGFSLLTVFIVVSSVIFFGTITVGSSVGFFVILTSSSAVKYIQKRGHVSDFNRNELLFGKYVVTDRNEYFVLVDTSYKFVHKDIRIYEKVKISKKKSAKKKKNRKKRISFDKKTFSYLLQNLKGSKYSAYAHCKICYNEQQEFITKLCNNGNFLYEKNCCKCGLPLVNYIGFTTAELFCVICASMNRYDWKNHGRCTLHLSSYRKGSKSGEVFCVYKNKFSLGSANKKKKKSNETERLKELIKPEVWKLNCLMRYEYFVLLKRIMEKELFIPFVSNEVIEDLVKTIEMMEKRKNEILNKKNFDFSNTKLKFNILSDFNESYVNLYCKHMITLIDNCIHVIGRHLEVLKSMLGQKGDEEKKKIIEGLVGNLLNNVNINVNDGMEKVETTDVNNIIVKESDDKMEDEVVINPLKRKKHPTNEENERKRVARDLYKEGTSNDMLGMIERKSVDDVFLQNGSSNNNEKYDLGEINISDDVVERREPEFVHRDSFGNDNPIEDDNITTESSTSGSNSNVNENNSRLFEGLSLVFDEDFGSIQEIKIPNYENFDVLNNYDVNNNSNKNTLSYNDYNSNIDVGDNILVSYGNSRELLEMDFNNNSSSSSKFGNNMKKSGSFDGLGTLDISNHSSDDVKNIGFEFDDTGIPDV